MGCWNGTDMVTHTPICYGDKVCLLVIKLMASYPGSAGVCSTTGLWEPVAPPLKGEYDDYGGIENIDETTASYEYIKGRYNVDDVDAFILEVERGHVEHLHLWMVHESTWEFLQTYYTTDLTREFSMDEMKEHLKSYTEVGEDDVTKELLAQMQLEADFSRLYSNDVRVRPMCLNFLHNNGGTYLLKFIQECINLITVCVSMGVLRRYFCPPAAAGSQCTEYDDHIKLAQLTIKQCKKGLTQEEDEDEKY
jgi:hypothetical protein